MTTTKPNKRRHVGRLVADYNRGRSDAGAGVYVKGQGTMYVQGWRDETRRMRLLGKCPQTELALHACEPLLTNPPVPF